ncbi:putative radical SAM enzyme, TIGR03279 family [Desulfonispora thiosulfatigenes DSM 11270]|uniref:Putative radical SAM enzyme, TIGR03279 family n=1 Tax=Desulfonispora thiosulfatigenes DSM 11270 TaxID=656914 RepID=A0A1W1VM50_DESTI|nr:DUF512 domain-containing protein [Desulfonispora thiosulfatigenes]SMB94442.1 putative radical SAM enzyme, TIGR03279 family [Desulfonispora thiosulfatigenes DSM 11270]
MGYAIISEVLPNSIAEELELEIGDKILEINNQQMNDLIDFQFLWADEEIDLVIQKTSGEEILYQIEKDYDESLGVVFEKAIFDKMRTCKNNCIFCFVAQMAPGMRSSLYDKDDDYRLSVLQGNFVTLTNLKDEDFDRIKRYHLSPLYVSVHTTSPDLRVSLLNNKNAYKIIDQLRDLAEAGIEFHCQIVLCPGINDGEYLERTLTDLKNLWPSVKSIAVVPVGITKFTKNPEKFPFITRDYAQNLVNYIENKQQQFKKELGDSLVFVADELYVKASKMFPSKEVYEEFPQTENGIGIGRIFLDEFMELEKTFPKEVSTKSYVVVTGVSGQFVLTPLIERMSQIKGLDLELKTVENSFFGPRVTVTGLLTGTDLIKNLRGLPKGTNVVISKVMLKQEEDVFLDGLTVEDVQRELNINLMCVDNTASGLINQILS